MIEKSEHLIVEPPAIEKGGVHPKATTLAGGFPGIVPSNNGLLFKDSVFTVDEATYRSSLPKVTHWSIAWSDLMMTMFILFLSMFVYQASHKEFLVSDESEVIGGDTTAALDVGIQDKAVFPFVPIKPAPSLMTSGTVKKVEPIHLQDIDIDTTFFDESKHGGLGRIKDSLTPEEQKSTARPAARVEGVKTAVPAGAGNATKPQAQSAIESLEDSRTNKIFSMGKEALSKLDLKNFATIELVPDNTMRIILTGDLLFDTGKAELSHAPKKALRKIADVIKNTPYMINVVGHTDNIPMNSERYATNWDLSVARASTVARFLVDERGLNPNQFVVSGYSSYRPIRPNTDARNRAANRRVEIIISKRLPPPVAASADNIN